jgi:FkbM family methyltransferase
MYKLIRKKISNLFAHPKKFEVRSYSQSGEDILIKSALDSLGVFHPTYLDIGANHPYFLSNTYLFYSAGCSGVLIEPNTTLFKNLKRKRKRDVCINSGVGVDDKSKADFYLMSADVLSTFSKEEAKSIESQGTYKIDKVVSVPLVNINNIIENNFTRAPDFVSIDIEGMDYSILKSFDFSRHRPAVFCAETLKYDEHGRAPKIKEIIDLMLDNNYVIYADTHINTIFLDNNLCNQNG